MHTVSEERGGTVVRCGFKGGCVIVENGVLMVDVQQLLSVNATRMHPSLVLEGQSRVIAGVFL